MPSSTSSRLDKYCRKRQTNVDNSDMSDKEFYAELEEGDPVADGTDWLTSLTGD